MVEGRDTGFRGRGLDWDQEATTKSGGSWYQWPCRCNGWLATGKQGISEQVRIRIKSLGNRGLSNGSDTEVG